MVRKRFIAASLAVLGTKFIRNGKALLAENFIEHEVQRVERQPS